MAIQKSSNYVRSTFRNGEENDLNEALADIEEVSWFLTQELNGGTIDFREATEQMPTVWL